MALQSRTITVGADRDVNNGGKNYVSGQVIYIKDETGVLAPIFRDIDALDPIAQNTISNVTNAKGQFTFFIEEGNYTAEYNDQSTPLFVFGADYFNNQIDFVTAQVLAETQGVVDDFNQEGAEALAEFDLTLDQYKESRGFNEKGTFAAGFTYELPNDVGLDADGNPWAVIDTETLPVVVAAGTTPTNPPFKQVAYGTAAQVSTNTSDTVQSFADSFALKIFQSPTDGLTEINTRTLLGGEVYEVRKVSDGSLATIYTDKEGLNPIAQNGTSNVSGSDGVVEFHIEDGSYYLSTNNKSGNFIVSNLIGELDTLQDAIDSKLIKAGDSIKIKERFQGSGGGGTWDVVIASSVTIPPESPAIGDIVACSNTPSLALKLRIENNSVHCKQIGAKFNGSFNDLPAVQWAIDNLANKNSIELSDSPRFESELKFPVDSLGYVMFSRKRITVDCDHNGNGLVLDSLNENYGSHVISNISFDGPNVHFPSVGYTPVSTGHGVNLEVAYFNTFLNCVFTGFLSGVRVSKGFANKFIGDCGALYNQYGVFLDNGPTNLNEFKGMRIRQNRKRGVFIDGSEGGPYPTGNMFNGAYIETNIPYNGGYPVGGTGDGETSTGVYINRAYDNDFTGTYFENQEYDVWLQGQTSGNKFNNTRHSPSSDYSRLGKIRLSGENCNNNCFNEAIFISRNSTDVHVESDNSNQLYNTFYDTTGINFINSAILAPLDIRNNSPYLASFGTPDGTICRPTYGYLANPTEGVLRGKIEGIGTDTATLHANGLGEVQIGSAITSDTTITSITGLKRGQMFVLWNYQVDYSVKIKSTTSTGNLLLKGLRDAVFTDFGQCIVFAVNGLGRICEIGRNFKDEQSGTATIPSGATSIVVPLPYNEPDFAFKVFVNATGGTGSAEAKGSVYVSGRNLNNITIATTVAPGGDGINVDWMVTRNY